MTDAPARPKRAVYLVVRLRPDAIRGLPCCHSSPADSACSSPEIAPSYVLRALGLSDEAAVRTLRVGIGRFTSPADIDYAASALAAAHSGRHAADLFAEA
jgi:hypothetical protein